ncbi:hypothetical protein ACTJJ0_15705 [Chitinophaga sp. 22321]|uniref:Uncharacterized protein n=1 Tax=Chitinophaga hostae TaxID=2831022 RepID=A0ABS5J2M5_9BACT|nr:hypothetical protein [Chitinophaga hostae]MBS0029478.1 hypothetical protein [Chitinophaga hostae]
MDAIITYDVEYNPLNPKNDEVKNGMKTLGYDDHFVYQDTVYYLPNTTLWKPDTEPLKAQNDLFDVAKKCYAKIERMFANELSSNWEAVVGKPYEK